MWFGVLTPCFGTRRCAIHAAPSRCHRLRTPSQEWEAVALRGPKLGVFQEAYEAALAACEEKGDTQLALRFLDVSFARLGMPRDQHLTSASAAWQKSCVLGCLSSSRNLLTSPFLAWHATNCQSNVIVKPSRDVIMLPLFLQLLLLGLLPSFMWLVLLSNPCCCLECRYGCEGLFVSWTVFFTLRSVTRPLAREMTHPALQTGLRYTHTRLFLGVPSMKDWYSIQHPSSSDTFPLRFVSPNHRL